MTEPEPPDLSFVQMQAMSRGHCPDCNYRGFVLGPKGGIAQNIECGNVMCRARFNVTSFGGVIMWGERIDREAEGGIAWPVIMGTSGWKGTRS